MPEITARLTTALADRYAIEREIGAGGMALVYLAEDLKLHRQVAIKVLRPELAVSLGADRFLQEIEVTANLQHPNILQLYEADEADDFLYYVMPYVEGETLHDRLTRDGKLSLDPVAIRERGFQAFEGVRHRFRRCEFRRESARCAEFGLPLGAPNGERPLGRATVETEKLLTRKRLAKCAARESNPVPTDEEFMGTSFGENP